MNSALQPTSRSRAASLSPFEIEVSAVPPRVAAVARRTDSRPNRAPEYGCVDWFQYPMLSDPECRAH